MGAQMPQVPGIGCLAWALRLFVRRAPVDLAMRRLTAASARRELSQLDRARPRLDDLKGAPASRGRLLLAHADATHGGAVARERRDRSGGVQARPVPVARVRADGPV